MSEITYIPVTLTRMETEGVERGSKSKKRSAIIAVNEDLGRFIPRIDFTELEIDGYLRGPAPVLWAHDRYEVPIATTQAIRKVKRDDGGITMEADFTFRNTPRAKEVQEAWDDGSVRAASIGVRERDDGSMAMDEWSIVNIPADPDAVTREAQNKALDKLLRFVQAIPDMSEKTENQRTSDAGDKPAEVSNADVLRAIEALPTKIADAMRSAAPPDSPAADENKGSGEADGAPAGDKVDVEAIRSAERERAEVLVAVKPLLDDEQRAAAGAMSTRGLMLAALGDEAPEGIAERSDDYVRAIYDGWTVRRAEMSNGTGKRNLDLSETRGDTTPARRPLSISQMRALGGDK